MSRFWALLCIGLSGLAIGHRTVAQPVAGQDRAGDHIPDFSEAGYGRVGETLPEVPIVERLAGGDDIAIQRALDRVAARPADSNGIRGAVLLGATDFLIRNTVVLTASGVVLRGTSVDGRRTRLVGVGSVGVILSINGSGRRTLIGKKIPIEGTVFVGDRTINTGMQSALAVGQAVMIQRPFTTQWVASIGMNKIAERGDGGTVKQWGASDGVTFERKVIGVEGRRVVLDAPIPDHIRPDDGATIWRTRFDGRVTQSAVEHLALVGSPLVDGAPPPGDIGIAVNKAVNVWLLDIRFDEFATFINVMRDASDVTIDRVTGAVKGRPRNKAVPTIFSVTGQRVLVQNCIFEGNRAHVWATQSRAAGPNVFRACVARGNDLDAGPHQRWATGTLYDNVEISGTLVVRNRENMGSGHGWAGATQVFWNSKADNVLIEQAPGSENWAVGTTGTILKAAKYPGYIISPGKAVEPKSLFAAQLVRSADPRRTAGGDPVHRQ